MGGGSGSSGGGGRPGVGDKRKRPDGERPSSKPPARSGSAGPKGDRKPGGGKGGDGKSGAPRGRSPGAGGGGKPGADGKRSFSKGAGGGDKHGKRPDSRGHGGKPGAAGGAGAGAGGDRVQVAPGVFKGGKPHAELNDKLVKLWNELRERKTPKARKEELVTAVMKLIGGRVMDVVMRHDASRVVQACLKHGSAAQRDAVCGELRGHALELTKAKHGHQLIEKTLHYGTPVARAAVAKELRGHVARLATHNIGALVLETGFGKAWSAETCWELYQVRAQAGRPRPAPLRRVPAQARSARCCVRRRWRAECLILHALCRALPHTPPSAPSPPPPPPRPPPPPPLRRCRSCWAARGCT